MRKVGRPRSCHCGTCEKCKRADYMREWWHRKTPEEKRAHIARRDPEKVREQDRRKQAKRRANPSKQQAVRLAAYRAVDAAKRRGELVPGICEIDGCKALGEAHHDDYSKPLEVRWLCRLHHDELHRNLKA